MVFKTEHSGPCLLHLKSKDASLLRKFCHEPFYQNKHNFPPNERKPRLSDIYVPEAADFSRLCNLSTSGIRLDACLAWSSADFCKII